MSSVALCIGGNDQGVCVLPSIRKTGISATVGHGSTGRLKRFADGAAHIQVALIWADKLCNLK
jgi:hypothetical protein